MPIRFLIIYAALITLTLAASDVPVSVPVPAPAPATPIPEGHSTHGEAFNEGPRQQAYLMDGMPTINFPVTTKNELAQKFFTQGVAQLHGFWYFEAERSFRQSAALDADCAMAYWGMAMANINNAKRATDFIKQAQDRKQFAGKREGLWIDSLAAYYQNKKDEKERRKDLIKAFENISFEFPDDIEAKAFLVFQIHDNSEHGIPVNSAQAVDALANEVLAREPLHPVHHYRIHLWDGDKAERALNSCALSGQCSPGIAHMWHMPGHIFSKLHRYADAAWQQEASARVDHAQTMRDHLLPDQIHNYAHNNNWLVQDLCYIGRVHDGIDLAKNMVELPRLPKFGGGSYTHGRKQLLEVPRQFELWDELIALCNTVYLEPTDQPDERAKRLEALGVAYFARGEKEKGQEQLDALSALLKGTQDEQKKAGESAEAKAKTEKKSDDQVKKAKEEAAKPFDTKIKNFEKNIADVNVYRALAGKDAESLRKALELAKDIPREQMAQLWLEAGDKEKAEKIAREAREKGAEKILPLANYADILNRCGKTKEAKEQFEKLRRISAYADLDLPIFQRLAPLAKELNLPTDWRAEKAPAKDVGVRPDLSTLGPFRWQPQQAPGWTLPDSGGKSVGLCEYRGKPVIVIFYLGYRCSHCMEQLNLFAPMAKDFADAGISLVAIGVDPFEDLKKTFVKGKEHETFPFPLLSDQNYSAFKAYRAYDDFEKMALHGTFLVDADGFIRWQDISFDPFREPKFLLTEAKRQLGMRRK